VLYVDDPIRNRAIGLFETTSRLGSNDALIAAVALENGLGLVSADQDFREVAHLRLIAPDSAEAAALIAD
jgi:predicted nucleic acid-binding protein